jgi:hypothetical protein
MSETWELDEEDVTRLRSLLAHDFGLWRANPCGDVMLTLEGKTGMLTAAPDQFPQDGIDLLALPGEIERLKKRLDHFRDLLEKCGFDDQGKVIGASENASPPPSNRATSPGFEEVLITTAEAARLLMMTSPELLRRHRDKDLRDEISTLPTPLRGYWDRQAVEALSEKWCSTKARSSSAVIAGAGGGA